MSYQLEKDKEKTEAKQGSVRTSGPRNEKAGAKKTNGSADKDQILTESDSYVDFALIINIKII